MATYTTGTVASDSSSSGEAKTIRMLLKECLEDQANIYQKLQEHFDKEANAQKQPEIPTPIIPNELDEIVSLIRELQERQKAVDRLLFNEVYSKL